MRTEQLVEVFTKQLGARKDGAAYLLPSDAESVLFVALEGETLEIPKVTRFETSDTLVFVENQKGERFIIHAEDIRAIRIDKAVELRRNAAGFNK